MYLSGGLLVVKVQVVGWGGTDYCRSLQSVLGNRMTSKLILCISSYWTVVTNHVYTAPLCIY